MPELVVLCGLQASGKSTFVREHLAATHEVVSKDLMGRSRRKEARQREAVAAALAAGRSVAVDNTNPTRAERAALLEVGFEHGALLVGCWFPASVDAALRRNALRSGRAHVPVVGVLATAKRFERPTVAEGFDVLLALALTEDGVTVIGPVGDGHRPVVA